MARARSRDRKAGARLTQTRTASESARSGRCASGRAHAVVCAAKGRSTTPWRSFDSKGVASLSSIKERLLCCKVLSERALQAVRRHTLWAVP